MNGTNNAVARGLVVLAVTWGMIASAAHGAPMDLVNGVPVTDLSGAAGSETFYRIEVPAGQDLLEIGTSAGAGDVDLYVRQGSEPTTTSYDYRPYKIGNEETVTVERPAAGTWYVMLRGYGSYSNVTLKAAHSGEISTKTLANGVPVGELSGAAGSEQFFQIEVPPEQVGLEIEISGGTGDADLYVRRTDVPTTTQYDYRPYLTGNDEIVSAKNPAAGTWHIMIKAKKAYADVTLTAGFSGGVPSLANGVPVMNLAGQQGSEAVYRINVPADQINLDIKLSGGTGDADLFVMFGSRPTMTEYDYRPFVVGNEESVTVDRPAAGAWYIVIRGYNVYANVVLTATYGEVLLLKDRVPVSDLSGDAGSERFFRLEVPAGRTHLLFRMSGGAGNADMYIRRNNKPTTSTWDYRPITSGNTESISIGGPLSGIWYVMLKGAAAYSGVTLEAGSGSAGTAIVLTNNVPIAEISGTATSELLYKIEVPPAQQKFEIRMSGGKGDADLYVRWGSAPEAWKYDYRPYVIGNEEAVELRNPQSGTWYIMIRGHQAFSGVTLVCSYGRDATPDDTTVLQTGVAVEGVGDAANGEKFYKIDVPAGQAKLEISTSGGTGDVDLYVRRGEKPSGNQWDYRPYAIGNNEKVTVENPQAGAWHIMLRGYTLYAGVTVKATYSPVAEEVTELRNGVPARDLSGVAGGEAFFKIEVPAGQASLEIAMSGGTGDVDLYVRKGSKPTITGYDYRPYLIGNEEKVEVESPAAAVWYVMLRGYQPYTGVTLQARYEAVQEKVTPVATGVPIEGLTGAAGSETFFSIEAPAGQDFLDIEIAGGTGNADLYVRKGSKPTTSKWDHRSDRFGNQDRIEIAGPDAATWFILLRGQQAYTGVTLTVAHGVQPKSNNFASDPNCVALWQFEDKAFAEDSVGSNRLVNHGASLVTTDAREGAGCADFRAAQSDWMSINDRDLSADFPTRSGGENADMSVCFWMKPRSFPARNTLISKSILGTNDQSWRLFLGGGADSGYLRLALGIGSGNNHKGYDLNASGQQFPRNQWYHVAFTYRDRDREFRVRIWDDVTGKLLYDYVGTAISRMAITDAPLVLGGLPLMDEFYDGLLDEVAVFNDVLTPAEIDLIRQGRYSRSK